MTTSGLAFAIHSLDFSKPENTRFQYGSSVCLLSIAAPMAGTCDDATPAMILATFRPRLGCLRFGCLRLGCRLCARAGNQDIALRPSGPAAVAFHRAAAVEHHLGVVVLRGPGHHGSEMTKRMEVGRAELGSEVDVAAELQHAVVVALENGVGLRRCERKPLEVFCLVRLEGLAVLILHQRHAEHVDAIALPRALRVEHEGARDVVIVLRLARHRLLHPRSVRPDIYSSRCACNVSHRPHANSNKAASDCRSAAS